MVGKSREVMQADPELRSMPVVLVTARVASPSVNGRQPPHADAYVTKPFSLMEIRSTIEGVLSRRQDLAQAA